MMGKAANAAGGLFAGRVAEQRRLAEVLSASAAGQPAAVLVHGEAGVGKTRLVREATEQYRAGGREVLWGTCVHFGASSVPFAPVVQALDSWAVQADPTERSTVLEGPDELSLLLPSMGMRSSGVPSGRLLPVVDPVTRP
jgi:predicted ATPase